MRNYSVYDILKLHEAHLNTDRHFFCVSIIPAHLTLFKAEQNQMLSSPWLQSCIVLIIYALSYIKGSPLLCWKDITKL